MKEAENQAKDPIKVKLAVDDDGYIQGWENEFFDGSQWQALFDVEDAVDMHPADLDTIVLGATRYTDGKLVVDAAKQAELIEDDKPQPTTDQQMLAAVMLRVAKLEAGA